MRIVVLLLTLAAAACSPHVSFPDNPVGPNGASQPFALDFSPRALFGGAGAVGTVTLSAPAPSGGVLVALTSSDDTVGVPPSVTVPAGALSTDFAVATQPVPADVMVSVQAAAGGRSQGGSLPVWAELPESFSWISEPGTFLGAGRIGRVTAADNVRFTASCRWHSVNVEVRGAQSWTAYFAAPLDQPLRVGTYEITGNQPGPGMTLAVGVFSPSCTARTGRFVVHETEVRDDGSVGRFRATFEQRCGGSLLVSGDVRVTNPRSDRSPFDLTPCLR